MDKAAIFRMYDSGTSKRKIAKQLGISRKTVDKYINKYLATRQKLASCTDPIVISALQDQLLSAEKMDTSNRTKRKFVGELKKRFYELIKINNERNEKLGPNKQEMNGAVLFRQLKREGFDIGETQIRHYYSLYRNSHKEVFIKQFYEYGDRVEFDFHQVKVLINNEVKVLHQTTISCPASNFIFIRLYFDEKIESVFRGLIEFFRYAGGVPNEVVFDNLKPVVKVCGYKNNKQLTEAIIKFSTYYNFKVNTCNPAKGNEKGHVENSGKNSRCELFSLRYQFESIQELQEYVENSLNDLNKDSLVAFEEEKKHLKPLPVHDYMIGKFGLVRVDSKYCVALVDTNHYSIPEDYIGQELRYSIINDVIVFYKDNMELCRHKKIDGKNSYSINIYHYLKTLHRKPGALCRSLALRQADAELVAIYQEKYKGREKEFIEFLYGNSHGGNVNVDVEMVSNHQLDEINKTFNIGA